MNVVYGTSYRTMPVFGSPLAGPVLPTVAPIPAADSPTPRRRRTTLCSNLLIEGQTWNLEEAKVKMRAALRQDTHSDIRCVKRPNVQIAEDYALDVCLSSWCHQCPFGGVPIADPVPILVAPPRTTPAPILHVAPVPAFPDWPPEVHAARIRTSIAELGVTFYDVSRVLGMGDNFVANVLQRLRPLDRLRDVDAVLDAMLAGHRADQVQT